MGIEIIFVNDKKLNNVTSFRNRKTFEAVEDLFFNRFSLFQGWRGSVGSRSHQANILFGLAHHNWLAWSEPDSPLLAGAARLCLPALAFYNLLYFFFTVFLDQQQPFVLCLTDLFE